MKPAVCVVQAAGTDGKQNLVDAIAQSFPQAHQLHCFQHLQLNIETHLHERLFPKSSAKNYVHDIFGYSTTDDLYHEGPVDSCSAEEYYKLLASMEVVWNEREKEVFSDQKSHQVEFFSWFLQYKSKEIREHTLRCLREEVGLGSPPKAYYTNDNKSINSLLKESTGYKKKQQ